jgi:hypothetical protein
MTAKREARNPAAGILAIAGALPVAVAAVNLPAGAYLAFLILVASMLLHLVFFAAGRFARGNWLRGSFLVAGSAILCLAKAGTLFIDQRNAPGTLVAMDMILFSGIMRMNASGWKEDLERGRGIQLSRMKAPAFAALFVLLAGFARGILGEGSISMPFSKGGPIVIAFLSGMPVKYIATPSGFLVIAGLSAAAIKALAQARKARKQ